jgi:hypothetical protein
MLDSGTKELSFNGYANTPLSLVVMPITLALGESLQEVA